MSDASGRIEQLRRFRVRPERELAIGPIVQSVAKASEQTHKKIGQLIDLWEELLPPELAKRTTITRLRAGTAQVDVDSAATAYEVDRLLREGLLTELRSRYPGTLVRVKIRQKSSA